jgi:hypothetical protein
MAAGHGEFRLRRSQLRWSEGARPSTLVPPVVDDDDDDDKATGLQQHHLIALRRFAPPVRPTDAETPQASAPRSELTERHHCSRTGLGPGVIAAHAIVLTPDSRVRLTSFDHGWKVLEGARPGTLLAVCRL